MAICSICHHPKKSKIDTALATGASSRAIAAQFKLSKSAVSRHRTSHLAPQLAAAAKMVAPAAEIRSEVERAKAIVAGDTPLPADILNLSELMHRLKRTLDRLETSAEDAGSDKLHVALAALSGQLLRGIDTAAKIKGLYTGTPAGGQPGLTVNITLPPGFTPSGELRNATPPAQVIDGEVVNGVANVVPYHPNTAAPFPRPASVVIRLPASPDDDELECSAA